LPDKVWRFGNIAILPEENRGKNGKCKLKFLELYLNKETQYNNSGAGNHYG